MALPAEEATLTRDTCSLQGADSAEFTDLCDPGSYVHVRGGGQSQVRNKNVTTSA